MATNCWPKAPRGGGGRGSWCPRTRGVAPPPPGAAAGAASGAGGAHRGAEPSGHGDVEGDGEATGRRPEEIVGPALAAQLERAAMVAEIADI